MTNQESSSLSRSNCLDFSNYRYIYSNRCNIILFVPTYIILVSSLIQFPCLYYSNNNNIIILYNNIIFEKNLTTEGGPLPLSPMMIPATLCARGSRGVLGRRRTSRRYHYRGCPAAPVTPPPPHRPPDTGRALPTTATRGSSTRDVAVNRSAPARTHSRSRANFSLRARPTRNKYSCCTICDYHNFLSFRWRRPLRNIIICNKFDETSVQPIYFDIYYIVHKPRSLRPVFIRVHRVRISFDRTTVTTWRTKSE